MESDLPALKPWSLGWRYGSTNVEHPVSEKRKKTLVFHNDPAELEVVRGTSGGENNDCNERVANASKGGVIAIGLLLSRSRQKNFDEKSLP